ncbi:MAG: GNAT family N-acetyltransferase [Pseudomonadota bacterium]
MSGAEVSDLIAAVLEDYPQAVKVEGGEEVVLRPAGAADMAAIVAFAGELTEQDLLFLRVDITQQSVVENWLSNVANGQTVSLLACQDERVVGYCTVDRNPARWTRRVGEIRVNVVPQMRSRGLGRHMTSKIFDVARRIGLRKLIAHMTPDQVGAQAAFARLGFRPEALLTDYIEDRDGDVHDLAIMTYDMDGFNAQVDVPLQV